MKRAMAGYAGVAIALAASLAALGNLLWLGSWFGLALLGALAVVVAMAVGTLVAPKVGPWVAGPLVALAGACALFAPARTWGVIIPTPASLRDLGTMLSSGARQAYLAVPPSAALGYVPVFLGCCAILTALVAGLVAVRLRQPMLAGAVLLGWWVLPVGRGFAVSAWVCLAFAAGICVMLWATPAHATPPQRTDRLGAASLGAATALAVVIAVVASGPLSTLLGVPQPGSPLGGVKVERAQIELSANADLLQDLSAPSPQVVVSRRGNGDGAPLRIFVAQEFDGSSWVPMADPTDLQAVAPSDVTGGVGPLDESEAKQMQLIFRSLAGTAVPLVISQRTFTSDMALRYSPGLDVLRASQVRDGDSVDFTFSKRDLSAQSLDDLAPTLPQDSTEALLQVPDSSHSADILALAHQLTDQQPTAYRKLVALQEYLRGFTYSLDAPPATTGDAVWDFLQAQQGYCVHSATAFIIMARDLGIPARLAIGYLPGSGSSADVLSSDAHAWPEVYFDQRGWVSFEPTPPSRTAAVESVPEMPGTVTETAAAAPGQVAPEPAQTSAPATPQADSGRDRASVGMWMWLLAGAVIIMAAAGVAVWRAMNVRREHTSLAAWRALRRYARRAGVEWPDSATARTAAAALRPHLDETGAKALADLVARVEHDQYELDDHESHHASVRALRLAITRSLPGRVKR